MNDVEVVFDSWRAVFRSSPLYLCDLACAEVGPRFLFDSIVLSTFRSHPCSVFWNDFWLGWMIRG